MPISLSSRPLRVLSLRPLREMHLTIGVVLNVKYISRKGRKIEYAKAAKSANKILELEK